VPLREKKLGTGESGKSTILKQMRTLYMDEFSGQELRQTGLPIFTNLLDAFRILLNIMPKEDMKFDSESAKVNPTFSRRTFRSFPQGFVAVIRRPDNQGT
jgi:hypothetical protein